MSVGEKWLVECINPRCLDQRRIDPVPDEHAGREVPCRRCSFRVGPPTLDGSIKAVLAATDPLLPDVDDVEQLRDAIADSDRSDDRALQAHDLLHQRAVFGRAW